MEDTWPSPAEALEPVARSGDPVERVAFAAEFLLRRVYAYRGSVRAMIAGTIAGPRGRIPSRPQVRPDRRGARPPPAGDAALDPDELARLKEGLWVVVSAEAFFTLTDPCGLGPDEAIAGVVRTASALTRAALHTTTKNDLRKRRS
jgi:hypothetical protein